MDEAVQEDRQAAAQDFLEEFVPVVAGIEPVAMMNVQGKPLVFDNSLIGNNSDAHTVPEVRAEPVIVISAEHGHRNACLPEIVQLENGTGCCSRNNAPVLEPEVEEIPDYVEVRNPAFQPSKKIHKICCTAGAVVADTEMGVGDKDNSVRKLCNGIFHRDNIKRRGKLFKVFSLIFRPPFLLTFYGWEYFLLIKRIHI